MKKGLSVLLIAAALFGFYGGATSLTDILASKDYWEEQGEKSTADMNKLEDGLNQLKDNEKAYLDGQKTLADGEKKLADAEVQLEEGRATLAKGYADYAAAPAKLADGRAKLADAEDQLAEGRTQLAGLRKLIAGCNQIINGYQQWKAGFNQLNGNEGRKFLKGAFADQYKDLVIMSNFAGNPSAFLNAVDSIKNDDGSASLDDIAASANVIYAELPPVNSNVTQLSGIISSLISGTANAMGSHQDAVDFCNDVATGGTYGKQMRALASAAAALDPEKAGALNDFIDKASTYAGMPSPYTEGAVAALNSSLTEMRDDYGPLLNKAIANTQAGGTLYDGLNKFTSGYAKLAENQYALASGVQQIAYNVVNNATLKKAVIKEMGASAVGVLNLYSSEKTSPLFKANGATSEKFIGQMENVPGVVGVLTKARALLVDTLADGTKTYTAGLREYNAGLAEYRQGLADYAAAPAKLADGEKQLADGEKQYADGKKQLEDGKKKLAEYEDGEQQVRDGLATLMATKADPGLESILDRSNGDDKFDDANGHLQLDKGLAAVDTGRGYQADSGELITKEITNRAVGTAAGLGAAALAVLAAILSFLKKSKGAAVSAVLAAVAGGIGAGVGLSAGEYYSDIAGSTIGNTPFIAAAVLAGVAAVFAIVHFTAKPEAK